MYAVVVSSGEEWGGTELLQVCIGVGLQVGVGERGTELTPPASHTYMPPHAGLALCVCVAWCVCG